MLNKAISALIRDDEFTRDIVANTLKTLRKKNKKDAKHLRQRMYWIGYPISNTYLRNKGE